MTDPSPSEPPEPWWRGAVIYQVYPRSFADADGDGVGDLAGIAARLDYIASLGVDGVWLSPFFRSPMKDFGYDVSDYRDVDPIFGTLADFDALLARAHGLGLKVVIDQVWSHTSDQHAWFTESRGSRDNPRADWYVWADAKPDGTPPNNWQGSFGGPAWTWEPRRRQYYLHNFLTSQPDLNFHCPAVQDAVLDVARFWLDRGVDGFRLDVVNYYAHDPELRDNPPAEHGKTPVLTYAFQRHVFDKSRPETLAFVARLRALTDSYPDRMLVGEISDDAPLVRQREYTDGPDRLHTAYSFFLLYARRATPALFREALAAWEGARGWPAWSLGNHDVPRFPSRLAGDDPRLTRTLLAVLLCLRGSAYLYQGEELGLPQAEVPFERLRDPFAIAAWTGGAGRDGARTPMPWAAQAPHAGFSTTDGETWLPLDPRHAALAVDRQEGDRQEGDRQEGDRQEGDRASMLAFTRAFLRLRRSLPALRTGDVALVDAPEGVLAFERRLGAERLLCAFELGGREAVLDLAPFGAAEALACGLNAQAENGELRLGAYGGAVLRLSDRD